MDSLSRQYYERNLGAGMFVSPETENGLVGYSEPLRRFIQHEGFTPQVNEIHNTMPSWIPGEDHLINFQKGDPYTKVDEGYARLPGAGYAALHIIYTWSLPPAHIKISPRAPGKAPPSSSAASFSIPIAVQVCLELTFWSARAIGQATLSVFLGSVLKTASALPLFLEFSSLAARPGRRLENSYFPTPKFVHGFVYLRAEIGMNKTFHWDLHDEIRTQSTQSAPA